jgi:hypothetical protein
MSKRNARPPIAKRAAKTDRRQLKRWKEAPVPSLDTSEVADRIGKTLAQYARPARKPPNDRM